MKSLSHQFLDFCRSKPADEEYRFQAINDCALCQFLRDTGVSKNPQVDYERWSDKEGSHPLPAVLRGAYAGSSYAKKLGISPLGAKPHTFGALADRLEKALAEQVAK